MGSIFICGNGFDLAHGLPTQYTDFRNFLLKKFPEADKLMNLQFTYCLLQWIMYVEKTGVILKMHWAI